MAEGATLELDHSTVTRNAAVTGPQGGGGDGGIHSKGTLKVSHSTISFNLADTGRRDRDGRQ